jgi:signal transduction histidine kinase
MTVFRQFTRSRLKRYHLFGRSLSARVLWLTIGIIMLVEIALLMPSLGRERLAWLRQHVTAAHLAAFAAEGMPDETDNTTMFAPLLKLADAESITLITPGKPPIVLRTPAKLQPGHLILLDNESLLASTWHADRDVLGMNQSYVEVIASSPLERDVTLDIVLNGNGLTTHLRSYATRIAGLSIVIAVVTGLLLFAALDRLLVGPMRTITASIVGFRKDPEQGARNDLDWLTRGRRDDEISGAARELKIMQDEMRAALWRNARLAAVGTAVAKVSHDMRNILSSALLVADRLQETADPAAKRAAKTLISAVDRAAQLVSRTVDFAREGPPAIIRSAVVLSELVAEASLAVRPDENSVEIDNQIPVNLALALDRAQIYRVLVNLMRNAIEAGADRITLSVQTDFGASRLKVGDNGPGLPLRVQENLFKPFTGAGRRGGTGLGLAIARDLIRAHGGDLTLADTGPLGTVFVMELTTSEVPA